MGLRCFLFHEKICSIFWVMLFWTYMVILRVKIAKYPFWISVIFSWKVMSWILLFHLLFWCHKILLRETSYSMVFGAISWYWEQTLTIFDDVLLEEAAHVQLGQHAWKSQKDWKNCTLEKSQVMLFALAGSSFVIFHGFDLADETSFIIGTWKVTTIPYLESVIQEQCCILMQAL